ncbi:unnamed protein product, partial [Symbiodinium sp. CCMP2592]
LFVADVVMHLSDHIHKRAPRRLVADPHHRISCRFDQSAYSMMALGKHLGRRCSWLCDKPLRYTVLLSGCVQGTMDRLPR